MTTPAVSVVMPVRDGAPWLSEACLSILGQSLTNLELIVIDDGSSDASPDILSALAAADRDPKPPGWRLSPTAVRRFIIGDAALGVSRKFYGDDPLVDRAIVSLLGRQGLMLVGEPGTAKSMLSELLATSRSSSRFSPISVATWSIV